MAPKSTPEVSLASPGFGLLDFGTLPADTSEEIAPLVAEDGMTSRGHLYTRGGEKTVVCFTHPRADMSRHYAMPALLEAGYATFGQQCRGLNNDHNCVHEALLFDIAAAMRFLKEDRGFDKVILFGNSGGGSLYSFYQAQATTAPPNRLTDTPAGDPCDLNQLSMPAADGMVNVAVHPGEGLFLLNKIDPSLTDEADPLSCDPELDMYNPANGFREPPEESKYSAEFLERYRAAQRARVERLDAVARGYIEEQRACASMMEEPGFSALPLARRNFITRRAHLGRNMIIYRTAADPAYCDLSLNATKSTRGVGSLLSLRPDLSNYMEGGFANYLTPRAYLSSWSGLSSRAATAENAARVAEPTLVLAYTADNACFPDSHEEIYQRSAATDKKLIHVDGDHFGHPLQARAQALDQVVPWLEERFPTR